MRVACSRQLVLQEPLYTAMADAPGGQMYNPDYQSCKHRLTVPAQLLLSSAGGLQGWLCNAGACQSSAWDSNTTQHASVLSPGQQSLRHVLPSTLCKQRPVWRRCISVHTHSVQQIQLKSSYIHPLLLSFLLVLQSNLKDSIAVS